MVAGMLASSSTLSAAATGQETMTADRTPTGGGGSEFAARFAADSVRPAGPQHPGGHAGAMFAGQDSRGVAAFAERVQPWRGLRWCGLPRSGPAGRRGRRRSWASCRRTTGRRCRSGSPRRGKPRGSRRPRGRRGWGSACRRGGASRRTSWRAAISGDVRGAKTMAFMVPAGRTAVGLAASDVAQRIDGKADQGLRGLRGVRA